MRTLMIEPLTKEAFAQFGDVIETDGSDHFMINNGSTMRFHKLATVETAEPEDKAIISIFRADALDMPLTVRMLERHPLGSQAFVPLGPDPWLSIVAPDEGGRPGAPLAFLVPAGMGVNLRAGVWHGVLTPLDRPADFLVVDREGEGLNLEEVAIAPVTVTA